MISVKQAVKALRLKGNLTEHGCTPVLMINAIYAEEIAELIEHLDSKCDLEVNELLAEVPKMKKYECIKSFSIPQCDGDGFHLEDEEGFTVENIIEKQTVWGVPEDADYRLVGGEVRLENDKLGWIEISKETLQECFKECVTDGNN